MPTHLTAFHRIICEFDALLRVVCVPKQRATENHSPSETVCSNQMTEAERRHSTGLMRVNHSGEVCAQALYRAQALTATNSRVRQQMQSAADEEVDHLAWCEQRLQELGGRTSVLNIFWYLGSFTMGAIAGLVSDQVSLGFVAETEHQVAAHLKKHIASLPYTDLKSRAILSQMHEDELKHALMAEKAGASMFPLLIKQCMTFMSRFLTTGSYYL